jgi:hypothetical protein
VRIVALTRSVTSSDLNGKPGDYIATIDHVAGRYVRIAAESNTVDVAPDLVQRIAAVSFFDNSAVCFEGNRMRSGLASASTSTQHLNG